MKKWHRLLTKRECRTWTFFNVYCEWKVNNIVCDLLHTPRRGRKNLLLYNIGIRSEFVVVMRSEFSLETRTSIRTSRARNRKLNLSPNVSYALKKIIYPAVKPRGLFLFHQDWNFTPVIPLIPSSSQTSHQRWIHVYVLFHCTKLWLRSPFFSIVNDKNWCRLCFNYSLSFVITISYILLNMSHLTSACTLYARKRNYYKRISLILSYQLFT